MISVLPQASGSEKKVKRIRVISNTIFLHHFKDFGDLILSSTVAIRRRHKPGHFALLTSPAHTITLRPCKGTFLPIPFSIYSPVAHEEHKISKEKPCKKSCEKGKLLDLCLFFSAKRATLECPPPATGLRGCFCSLICCSLLSSCSALGEGSIWFAGCEAARNHNEQRGGNSPSADQAAELQPL